MQEAQKKFNDDIFAVELDKVSKTEEMEKLKSEALPEAVSGSITMTIAANSVANNPEINRSSMETDSTETNSMPQTLTFSNMMEL